MNCLIDSKNVDSFAGHILRAEEKMFTVVHQIVWCVVVIGQFEPSQTLAGKHLVAIMYVAIHLQIAICCRLHV